MNGYNAPMPKLTLRDLFAVVTIAAILVAWWLDHARFSKEIESLRRGWEPLEVKNLRHGFTLDVF